MSDIVAKLTDKQTALVDTLVAEGCSIKDAAHKAGYAQGEAGRVTASKALRLPHVQAYMMQRVNEQLGLSATTAAAKLLGLAKGAKSEGSSRLSEVDTYLYLTSNHVHVLLRWLEPCTIQNVLTRF